MFFTLSLAFCISLLSSLLLTPLVRWIANRIGAVDVPGERKIHSRPVPRLGGVAVCASMFIALLVVLFPGKSPFFGAWIFSTKGTVYLLSLLIIFLTGVRDDFRSLGPGLKFLVEFGTATLCYLAGFQIPALSVPFIGGTVPLGILNYPVTIIWIVGVTNAFNLIDGLDGLAAGVGAIASLSVFSILLLSGDMVTAALLLILAASLLGFLRYNFHPARIFLGDSGSLTMGFSLAALSIQGSTKGSTAVAALVPLLALGLPIIDTLVSMLRRFFGSLLPESSMNGTFLQKLHAMFIPDRKHIHHRLLTLGLSHRNAVLALYCVSGAFGLGAVAVSHTSTVGTTVIICGALIATIAGVHRLQYREMAILRNGALLPLAGWPLLTRGLFQGCLDFAFTIAAFCSSAWLTMAHPESTLSPRLISLAGLLQVTVFYLLGLYQGAFRYVGIGDILTMVRIVAASVVTACIAFLIAPDLHSSAAMAFFLTDFYILLTLVIASRISFHILNFLFRREPKEGKNVLIFGANNAGLLTLQQILNDETLARNPIGFLDESPRLEGKLVNGYRVFGGHWKLAQLISKYRIDEIVLAGTRTSSTVLHHLERTAKIHGVSVIQWKVTMEELTAMPRPQDQRYALIAASSTAGRGNPTPLPRSRISVAHDRSSSQREAG